MSAFRIVAFLLCMTVAPEILYIGAQNLLASLLALSIRHSKNMPHHSCVTLCIWQLVRVHISNCADDALQTSARSIVK